MINQTWLRMAGDLNYIFPKYVFSLSLVSLTKYVGQTEEYDIDTYGRIIHVYIFSQVRLFG